MQQACAAASSPAWTTQGHSNEEALAAEVLLGLLGPAAPAPGGEHPAAGSTASGSVDECGLTESDADEAERRPRKVRVVADSAGGLLPRRTYTWRGLTTRRAQKQQRQLDALAAQQQQQQQIQQQQAQGAGAPPADEEAAATPAYNSASLTPLAWPASPVAAAGRPLGLAHTFSPSPTPDEAAGMAAAEEASGGKEGHRDWAALTTWLRMNLHQPRTAKKVVQFWGQRDPATGRLTFALHPALRWHDLSADTRHRLRHLPAEAAKAFACKYPARPADGWKLKSQKYKLPGSQQPCLVLVEDLVQSLHALWRQHEGSAAAASVAGDGVSAAAAAPAAGLEVCSSTQLAAWPQLQLPPLQLALGFST